MVNYAVLKGLYDLEKTIGCGGFGKVKLATHILTREKVAIKIMDKACLGDDLPRVKRELEALKNLTHHHIYQLYQVIETDTHFFMVVEYCSGGELFDHIVERNRLGEGESRTFFRQIVSAVAYLHNHGYAHRDIKPENVLLDKEQNLKLIDFGLIAKPKGGLGSHLFTFCGSPAYAAPELILGEKYFGSEADIWGMGVLLFALLCGYLPFDDDNVEKLYRKILRGQYEEPGWLSVDSRQLIRSMLQVDPKKRITIDQLLHHQWLMAGYLDPVRKDSIYKLHEKDDECINFMAQHYGISNEAMWAELNTWCYDYETATYLVLLARKRRGLPIKLVRMPLKTRMIGDIFNKVESKLNTTPTTPNTEGTPKCLDHYIVLNGKESTPDRELDLAALGSPVEVPLNLTIDKEVMEEKENKKHFLEPQPPTPHRKPHKRFWSPGLDEALSPVPAKMTPRRAADRSHQSTLERASGSGCLTPMAGSPRCARKVLCSIERSLHRVRHVLTPRRRAKTGCNAHETQPAVLAAKDVCNVSTTSCCNPEQVLEELRKALHSKGIVCRQKGFTLRGKVEHDAKGGKLSFELEVCLVVTAAGGVNAPVVGIRRKRLRGDAWRYKKVCEEVLALAATDTS